MRQSYSDLGRFSDLVRASRTDSRWRHLPPGPSTRALVKEALAFHPRDAAPLDLRTERTWERDGISGEEISWSVGYGPRTHAYMLRPAGVTGRLPGVVAFCCHSGFYYFGKEKIADGPEPAHPDVLSLRRIYGGRAWANALAARGFAVLVPDTFMWGSRRFEDSDMTERYRPKPASAGESDVLLYNEAAAAHEHVIGKFCNVLGTSLAGIVNFEDRVAATYLAGRSDVDPDRIGSAGLSGGGLRSGLLQATCDSVRACVVVGMMSTYEGLLDHNMTHTWMLFPPALPGICDYPNLVACRAPSPLLVQYCQNDPIFTMDGMQAADRLLSEAYASVGGADAYSGRFYPGVHQFTVPMQEEAFDWLEAHLS